MEAHATVFYLVTTFWELYWMLSTNLAYFSTSWNKQTKYFKNTSFLMRSKNKKHSYFSKPRKLVTFQHELIHICLSL